MTTAAKPPPKPEPATAGNKKPGAELDVQAVFAKLKQLGGKPEEK